MKTWLKGVESYTLHRDIKRRFRRNPIYVSTIDELWHTDLADVSNVSQHNDGFKYILVCIDVFSKFLFTVALKTKTGREVVEAFKTIFKTGRQCQRLVSDKGTEYYNQHFKNFLSKNNIIHTSTENEVKACVAERCIKTLKLRIYRYFTHKQTYRYIDKLQHFTSSYNNTSHRTIKRPPAEVNVSNSEQVWFDVYARPLINSSQKKSPIEPKLKIGDLVRITHNKTTFQRAVNQLWTGEVFSIVKINRMNNIPVYVLQDYSGEPVKGFFYSSELQHVLIDKDQPYKIQKILKTRKKRGVKQCLVLWAYWPDKFASWVDQDTLKRL